MDDAMTRLQRSPNLALPLGDDPLARLVTLGPAPLALWELINLVLGARDATGRAQIAGSILAADYPSVQALATATFEDLAKAIGPRRAGALLAAVELGRRAHAGPPAKRPVIRNAADVHQLLSWDMRHLDREHFRVLPLNTRHQVLRVATVSVGGLSSAQVHPREVFKEAIRCGAAAVIVVHNHPSGDPTPSNDDRQITEQLSAAGTLVGIPILDHIIIGDGQYVSLRELGHLGR
jgi:DNA repair protein RadC